MPILNFGAKKTFLIVFTRTKIICFVKMKFIFYLKGNDKRKDTFRVQALRRLAEGFLSVICV